MAPRLDIPCDWDGAPGPPMPITRGLEEPARTCPQCNPGAPLDQPQEELNAADSRGGVDGTPAMTQNNTKANTEYTVWWSSTKRAEPGKHQSREDGSPRTVTIDNNAGQEQANVLLGEEGHDGLEGPMLACLQATDCATHLKVSESALEKYQMERLQSHLENFKELFNGRLGKTTSAEHSIDTGNAKPVNLPPYRTSPAKKKLIEEQIDMMLEGGIIEPASGLWAAPALKPTGEPRLQSAGLTLKLRKFSLEELKFLGYRVNPQGILPDMDKVKAVSEFPAPTDVRQVQQFLGLTSYYCRFIKDYAKHAD
ncbi:hypothetical protein SKAU_G00106600 [Synaphobranchus kaupii]|uniref:Uncharacterized protein n=1 Tax=Synaphobranchus kaupii TaxID=118154 RepID=A0A9Q1FZV2_SYNKA|nr:hypothetical protein SKAU_G00106600 [Synaphobranchus kaupii]